MVLTRLQRQKYMKAQSTNKSYQL